MFLCLLVAAGATSLAALAAAGPRAHVSVKKQAKVMSWNVHGHEIELDGVVATIGNQKPDVIALQEVCVSQLEQIQKLVAERYHVHYHRQPGSISTGDCPGGGSAFGEGILSKRKMKHFKQYRFKVREPEPRGMMAVTIKLGRHSVRVFNTHIGLKSDTKPQIRKVAKITRRYKRAIVMGDFNVDPTSALIAPMFKRFKEHRNGPWTFDYRGKKVKIDYIFRRGIRFVREQAFDTSSSDHRPFLVVVRRP